MDLRLRIGVFLEFLGAEDADCGGEHSGLVQQPQVALREPRDDAEHED